MRVSLISNILKDADLTYTKKTIQYLIDSGIEVLLQSSLYDQKEIKDMQVSFVDDDVFFGQSDVLVTLGGDGTILWVAPMAAVNKIPILGVNLGRLGYLAQLEKQDIHKIVDILNGKYAIEQRMMLHVTVQRGDETLYEGDALNDVTLNRQNNSQAVCTRLFEGGAFVYEYQSDGLIFATPTGSTAYSLSAGGPIIDPTISNVIIANPICEHSLFSRPIIFDGNSLLTCEIENRGKAEVCFHIDGKNELDLQTGDRILIHKSTQTVSLLTVSKGQFYTVLNEKFSGRGIK